MAVKIPALWLKKCFIPIVLVVLYFCFVIGAAFAGQTPRETGRVKPDSPKIIFSDGDREYIYGMEELGLAKLEGEMLDLVPGEQIYCFDHALLSYRLYKLSLEVNRPCKPASYALDEDGNIVIIPGVAGKELDLGLLIQQLGNPGFYQKVYSLPLKISEPDVLKNGMIGRMPRIKWAEYSTILDDIPDRTENVRVASQRLHGLAVPPGGEVSFNEVVGPRIKDQGFREAKVIVGGRFEPGLGGGVCQVSSTLYNAVLLAGLDIKERHNHSVKIAYVPLGQDATVVFGGKDLKFVNNTGSYLMIQSKLAGLKLEISIYSNEPPSYEKIEISTNIIKSLEIPEIYITNPALGPLQKKVVEKGQRGYVTKTYRTFIQGESIRTELLSKDYYAPISSIIAISSGINANN